MRFPHYLALVVLLGGVSTLPAQAPTPLQTNPPAVPAPAPDIIAATVNNQKIQELAVFRAPCSGYPLPAAPRRARIS